MTIKELAHSIVDSFNENQLKGFVDLFIKSEPAVEERSIETIMRSLAMDYIHNYSSARYREGINDQMIRLWVIWNWVIHILWHICVHTAAL